MHNWIDNVRVRIKCYLNGQNPEIDSVTSLFLGANWQERETYDFYGIIFKGHPQLKRILNMDEMVSFPMHLTIIKLTRKVNISISYLPGFS